MYFYLNEIYENKIYTWMGIFILLNFSISFILMIVSYFLIAQDSYNEKISAYECGFDPFGDARNKFDVRFYIVAILFLIFDIEVLYLFPWASSLSVTVFYGFWGMMIFLIVLILGFFYEIYMNALEWQ